MANQGALYSWAGSKIEYTGDEGHTFRHAFCGEGGGTVSNQPIGQTAPGVNGISNRYPMAPVRGVAYRVMDALGAWSPNVGARQVLGRVPDLYATSTDLNTGDTMEANPASPTREWAVMGDAVVPWDGSVPIVT